MAGKVTRNKVMHQETWLWRDIWALPSLSCSSTVHWEAKCDAVRPYLTNTHTQTCGPCDQGGQRQGRVLHGTLDMIRSHSPKCLGQNNSTVLKSKQRTERVNLSMQHTTHNKPQTPNFTHDNSQFCSLTDPEQGKENHSSVRVHTRKLHQPNCTVSSILFIES